MARSWFSVCFLALLSSGVVPEGEETPSWISGNLQGMMFSVMNGGNVRFHSDNPSNFTGLTVCLRVLTEQTFSIQLNFINQTHFVRLDDNILYVNGRSVSFYRFFMVPVYQEHWPWKNRCLTWESSTGMAQLWSDGKMSVRKGIARGQVFSDLDELLFDQFVGQVSDIYVWDRALGPQDLYNFLYYHYYLPSGNILDWHQIQYNTSGYAVLEPTFVKPYSVKSTRQKKQKKGQGLRRRVHKERIKKKINLQ
ncbi:serum amyloid P-component isoform X1 [Astyanax mexicanus]|uniref:serum amyloid P-component isoform X1 n=1 Tax=Astyanax mexicanus TaxID=7994 RepID=UPI0020CAA440|nr:serum amyloid P-component isoform X1 [Astyanax mexicanus]